MAKMRSLHMKRTESRTLNHREVVEEDRRNKEPKNMEARKKRADYVLKEVSWNHQSTPSMFYKGWLIRDDFLGLVKISKSLRDGH